MNEFDGLKNGVRRNAGVAGSGALRKTGVAAIGSDGSNASLSGKSAVSFGNAAVSGKWENGKKCDAKGAADTAGDALAKEAESKGSDADAAFVSFHGRDCSWAVVAAGASEGRMAAVAKAREAAKGEVRGKVTERLKTSDFFRGADIKTEVARMTPDGPNARETEPVGDRDGVGEGVRERVGEGECDRVGEGVRDAVGDGVCERVAVTVGLFERVGVGERDRVGTGDRERDGVIERDGEGRQLYGLRAFDVSLQPLTSQV